MTLETGAPENGPIMLDHDFFRDPHPVYREIKKNGNKPTEVILKTGMAYIPPGLKAWLVTSYEDIESVLRDPRFAKSIADAMPLFAANAPARQEGGGPGRSSLLYDNMANNDPPKHTRLRKPLNGIFTSRAVAPKRADIERAAAETLDAVAAAHRGRDGFDLVQDFAFPFSIAVICDTLGVPVQDRAAFNSWVQTITGAAGPEELARDAGRMAAYLRDLLRAKRTGTEDDVLSLLARSLDEDEAVAQAYALLAAGYETTANLIVTGFLTLEADPQQKRRLWSDPALVPGAVEEMLRHQSPFNLSLYRYVTETTVLNGVELPAGAIVFLAFAAANRDDRRFARPDEFAIEEPRREHLAFGGGIHNCIGKHLARLEAEVAFGMLIQRCPELSVLAPPAADAWKVSPTFRGLRNLRVGPVPGISETGRAHD
ncbi:cytochrome P450 [Streptomyces sp. NPDC052496]|uniref:cytochrome P450 n=1 Tax=Streptomyces sp. NPDC052496 TaxID=3154951 RepID=UPI0034128C60